MPTVADEYYIEEFWKLSGRGELDKCWEWTGHIRTDGYGSYTPLMIDGKKITKAPNISWIIFYRSITPGYSVLHRCDNRLCVNPNHLFLGTPQDNMDDMVEKDRQCKGERHPKSKLNPDQVREIRTDPRKQVDIALEYGISQNRVSMIKRRKCWGHI